MPYMVDLIIFFEPYKGLKVI